MAVRGSFDLNDRPATEALRRIQREGLATDEVMRQVGDSVDGVFSTRNREEAESYKRALKDARQEAEDFGLSLKALGTIDARPRVHLDGLRTALADADRLEARLRALGTVTARPSVRVSSGRVPNVGGGGGSFGGSGGGFGIPSAAPLIGAALAAAPPLIGGATGLIGSAGSAALGAGALGITGFGVAGTAAALTAPTTIEAVKGMKEASKALAAYQKQVIKTGPASKKAEEDLRLYNIALQSAPGGTGRFLRARTLLKEEFKAASAPGQTAITGIGTRGVNLGRQLTPLGTELSNRFLGKAQGQTNQFANFLNDPRSRDFYRSMGNEATADLSSVENIAENVLGTMENIARAGRPFFHEGVEFLDTWTGGWQKSTHDLHGTRQEIGAMVDQLKSWGHLGGAGFELLKDLLAPASGSGQTMVDDLTQQLREWDRWVQNNPRQVSQFFHSSAEGTEKIAGSLAKITTLLWRIGQQLAPLLEQGSNLVGLLGNAGLLSPGGLPLLIAGGAGIRNVRRGFGERVRGETSTRGGASGTGTAPVIIGAGGRFGTYGSSRFGAPVRLGEASTAYALEREAGASVLGAGATTLRSTRFGGALETFGRGVVGHLGPLAGLSFALGAAGTQGNFGERLRGGLSQATFGAFPMPLNPDEKYSKGQREALESLHNSQIVGHHLGLNREQRMALELHQAIGQSTYSGGNPELAGMAGGYAQRAEQIRNIQASVASGLFAQYRQGYAIRTSHGVGSEAAFGKAIGGIESQLDHRQGRVAQNFAQESLTWARALASANPKLKSTVNDLAEAIEARFTRMGRQVEIINGKIVDTSARSWNQVQQSIGSASQVALAEVTTNFTALEKRAFAILQNMGYNRTEAQSLVHEAQTGKPTKAGSAAGAAAHHHGQAGSTIHNMNHALGGRLAMPASGSLHDVVHMGGGNYAAGGELMIDGREVANRHTERKLNRLLAPYGTSLAREIAMEGRSHSEPFRAFSATGGRGRHGHGTTGTAWRGIGPAGLHQGIRTVAGEVLGHFPGLQVTSTTSGSHVSGSLHYAGEAVDVSGDSRTMYDASSWIKQSGLFRQLAEGIHNPNLAVSEGHIESGPGVYGAVWAGHTDHIHLGVTKAVGQIGRLAAGGKGAAGAAAHAQMHLQAVQSKLGGFGGAAVNRAGQMHAAGLSRNLNKLIGAGRGGRGGGVPSSGGPVIAQIGRGLLSHGLNKIGAAGIIGNAKQESGWNPASVGSGGGGLWGFTASPYSLADLQAYASQQGRPWADAGLQTQFLLKFLSGSLKQKLNSSASPGAAASVFMSDWERPLASSANLPNREQGAREAFAAGYSRGGRLRGFAGWHAKGGHFRVSNPTLFGAGEAGTEDVHIIPRGRGGGTGSAPISVTVRTGPVHVHSGEDAHAVGRKFGDGIAEKLAEVMESGDGVPERSLTG